MQEAFFHTIDVAKSAWTSMPNNTDEVMGTSDMENGGIKLSN